MFPSKVWAKKVRIIHGIIWYLFSMSVLDEQCAAHCKE